MVKTEKVGFLSQVHQGVRREAQQKTGFVLKHAFEKSKFVCEHIHNLIDKYINFSWVHENSYNSQLL